MSSPTRKKLMEALKNIREECDRIEKQIGELVPEREWLTTRRFAEFSELSAKTVANYCQQKRIGKCRKTNTGRWLIHKSELRRYN